MHCFDVLQILWIRLAYLTKVHRDELLQHLVAYFTKLKLKKKSDLPSLYITRMFNVLTVSILGQVLNFVMLMVHCQRLV